MRLYSEPNRVVRELNQRETDRLPTERLIDILEKLRPLLSAKGGRDSR